MVIEYLLKYFNQFYELLALQSNNRKLSVSKWKKTELPELLEVPTYGHQIARTRLLLSYQKQE
jgi:hypothetical protein